MRGRRGMGRGVVLDAEVALLVEFNSALELEAMS